MGQKVFEIVLIPRVPGKVTLPGLEFSFFDPLKKQYVTQTTEPIQITVNEAAPGSQANVPSKRTESAAAASGPTHEDYQSLKLPEHEPTALLGGWPVWRILYWLCCVALAVFGAWVMVDILKKVAANSKTHRKTREKAFSKSWGRLALEAKQATTGASWQQVVQTYEKLCGAVFDAIDHQYRVGARGLARSDLRQILVEEQGMPLELWEKTSRLLEFAEMVRFASMAISETEARNQLGYWVSEGQTLAQDITSLKN